ncbi:MAG: pilus assembly protein CpaF [Lachnospiraceae bacterium]|nr:pilus assembly protein CpaF [Lachnospiraceae bacterium]
MRKSYTTDELVKVISDEFGGILRSNLYETTLKEDELEKLRKRKIKLRESLKNCGIGDNQAKEYVKGAIKSILTEKLKINGENIDKIIPFDNENVMSTRDKFDIALYRYKVIWGYDGLSKMLEEYKVGEGDIKCFNDETVDIIYRDCCHKMEFDDKLNIVAERVYAHYRGLGVVDEIRDMNVDGVLGGVSGREGTYNSVWVVHKGVMIHFTFLDFACENELARICMNIYRYDNPRQLSRKTGYVVNQMKDHSRVVVVRPPFSESYAFFVRKFNTIKKKDIKELIKDDNAGLPIDVIKWIVKGCQVTAVTGMQGSGKTTLLMAMIEYIHPAYTLRIQEMAFELHLRDVYEDRNIITFRETDDIPAQDGLDLQKKTDGNVNILGEIASSPVAALMVQMTQSGSIFTMFTHHAVTTDSLIKYLRNSLLSCKIFTDERVALEQVVQAVRFDIHLSKSVDGHRYIQRITQIRETYNKKVYETVDIVSFENGRYMFKNMISDDVIAAIKEQLTEDEKGEFDDSMALWKS